MVVYTGWYVLECVNHRFFYRITSALILLLMYTPSGRIMKMVGLPTVGEFTQLIMYMLIFVMSLRILLNGRCKRGCGPSAE